MNEPPCKINRRARGGRPAGAIPASLSELRKLMCRVQISACYSQKTNNRQCDDGLDYCTNELPFENQNIHSAEVPMVGGSERNHSKIALSRVQRAAPACGANTKTMSVPGPF